MLKTSWIRALFNRAQRICSTTIAFNKQVEKITTLMSWNGFPSFISRSILRRLKSKIRRNTEESPNEIIKIFVKPPYAGLKGEQLLKACFKKMKRFLKPTVCFVTLYQTKKVAMFCPTKDRILTKQKANVIYELKCPGCGEIYIGKTDRNIVFRLREHGLRYDQPMNMHLSNCPSFRELINLFTLPNIFIENGQLDLDIKGHILNAVFDNFRIVDNNNSWSQLCFLEAFYIKQLSPTINKGLKASKELQLFR